MPTRVLTSLALALLALTATPHRVAAEDEMSADGWSRRELFVDDTTIEFFEQGEGAAVLMHPSLGRAADDFRDLGARVADAGYRVVLLSPRGIGASKGALEDATLHDLAADLWRVADALAIERAFLLGHGFGDRVCRTASADQPDRVIGLLLLASGGELQPSPAAWAEFERVFPSDLPPQRRLEAVARSCFAPGSDPSPWSGGWHHQAAKAQAETLKRTDFAAVRDGGTAPALLIQGLDDVITTPENAWRLVRRRPRTRLVALPDTGHAMLPEQPEAIAAAVIDFVHEEVGRSRDRRALGDRLYQLVEAYAALGEHRVGTDTDAKTIAWFAAELERRGATVTRKPFGFERYDGRSTVTIDGEVVPSLPLYYESTGVIESASPRLVAVDVLTGDRTSASLERAIAEARAAGAKVLVVATDNPLGLLQTPNREPGRGSGLPVVLVPGSVAPLFKSGEVQVRFHGAIAPGRSANVVASFGDTSKRPVVVSTPLSGWFTCAAERGTGVAVALELAARIAKRHPVLVVGTPGHELLYVGLADFLRRNEVDPRLVVHLGANVALGVKDPDTGRMRLAPGVDDAQAASPAGRALFARMDADALAAVAPAVRLAGLTPVLDPPEWHGEGALWAQAVDAALLSFVGAGPRFHTPADVPEDATGPELLATVLDAIETATYAYLRAAPQ